MKAAIALQQAAFVLRLLLLDHPVETFKLEGLQSTGNGLRLIYGNWRNDWNLAEIVPHRLDVWGCVGEQGIHRQTARLGETELREQEDWGPQVAHHRSATR